MASPTLMVCNDLMASRARFGGTMAASLRHLLVFVSGQGSSSCWMQAQRSACDHTIRNLSSQTQPRTAALHNSRAALTPAPHLYCPVCCGWNCGSAPGCPGTCSPQHSTAQQRQNTRVQCVSTAQKATTKSVQKHNLAVAMPG
jgi:hypothetical protein